MRSASRPAEPSASKIPARNPFRQASLGSIGQRTNSRMRSTRTRADVATARTARDVPVAAWNADSRVSMPAATRNWRARSSASGSARRVETSGSSRLATGTRVCVRSEVPVAADDPAEVAAAVVAAMLRRRGEAARSQQLVVRCQVRTLLRSAHGADHVLPPAVGEEPVVAAGDDLRPVLQRHAVRRLDRRPVREHLRRRRSGGTPREARCRRCGRRRERSASGRVRPSASRIGVSPQMQ